MQDPHPDGAFFTRRELLYLLATWAIVYLRLMYQVSYFPPYFWGEEARVLDVTVVMQEAARYHNSWRHCFIDCLSDYNKGYSWFILPFYLVLGYDVRIITYIVPAFVALSCAFLFFVYRKANPEKNSLWSFVLIASFALFATCVRRYKWHTVAYPGALSVYLFFLPEVREMVARKRVLLIKGVALAIFAINCFFYFGNIIYTVPAFGLYLYFALRKKKWRSLLFAGAFAILAIILQVLAYRANPLWAFDIDVSVRQIVHIFSHKEMSARLDTVDHFFRVYLSTPFICLLAIGLACSLYRVLKRDSFAIITMVLFFWLFGMQFIMWGINNIDCLNWAMIPLLITLLIGADQILVFLKSNIRVGYPIFVLLALGMSLNEFRYYPFLVRNALHQWTTEPHNTTAQAALVLRLIKEDKTGSTQYYLPAASMPSDAGGFSYEEALKRKDYKETWEGIVQFAGEDDLRKKLREPAHGRARVAFLSISEKTMALSKEELGNTPLLECRPEIISPYKEVYGFSIPVRKYAFASPPK